MRLLLPLLGALSTATANTANRDPTNVASYYNLNNGDAAPGASPNDTPGQTMQVGHSPLLGNNSASQVPWCPTGFVRGAHANGGPNHGWKHVPQVTGFDLRRDVVLDHSTGAVVPYYLERKDWSKVKRAVVVNPGLPRDTWTYVNLVRNAHICAASNESMGVSLDDVIVSGPVWMSEKEKAAGAAGQDDAYFKIWSQGSEAAGPPGTQASAFEALDRMVDFFFDQQKFPNLGSVVVAGHSLGGAMTTRYAMLRKSNPQQDPYMHFVSGNPSAYVSGSDHAPVFWRPGCQDGGSFTAWPYGLNSNIPNYRSEEFQQDPSGAKQNTLNTFYGRQVSTIVGESDLGLGDHHAPAQCEGNSHLHRGHNYQKWIQSLPGNPAATHSFSYLPYTAHQDYKVYAHPETMTKLFSDGLNSTRPQASALTCSCTATPTVTVTNTAQRTQPVGA